MEMSQDRHVRQNHNMKIDNKSFEWAKQFRYLGTNLRNQSSVHGEIKSKFQSGNACYHPVQNILSCGLLSKNVKGRIYRTIILPVFFFCMGVKLGRSH